MRKIKPPSQRGGVRPGAGRPKGAKNKSTLARELAANKAVDEVLAKLEPGQAERLTPIEVMSLAMATLLKAGNLIGAVAVAEKLAPYVHSKVATMVPPPDTPDDLAPDPAPKPDEPGPASPIL